MQAVRYVLSFVKNEKVKKYIGHTSNFDKRLKAHLRLLSKRKHPNVILQKAYDYGYEYDHKPDILYFPNKHLAHESEQQMIEDHLDDTSFVNIELRGNTYSKNPNKEDIRIKLVRILQEFRESLSEEERETIYVKLGDRNGMFGKTHTEEARKIMSEKTKERYLLYGVPNLGKKASSETKAKLSKIASLRLGDKNPFFNKSHSDESKRKISESNIGKLPPNMRKVSVLGTEYISLTEAGRQLGIHTTVVLFRVNSKNPKFSEWKFL